MLKTHSTANNTTVFPAPVSDISMYNTLNKQKL